MIIGTTRGGWNHSEPPMVRVMDHPDVSHRRAHSETYQGDAPAFAPDSLDGLVSDQLANLDLGRGNVSPTYDDLLDPQVARAEATRLDRQLRIDYARFKAGKGPKPDWERRKQEIAHVLTRATDSRARSAFTIDQDEHERSEVGHQMLDDLDDEAASPDEYRRFLDDDDPSVQLRARASVHSMHVADFLREVTSGDRYEDDDPLVPHEVEQHRLDPRRDPHAARLAFQQFTEIEDHKTAALIEEIGLDRIIERWHHHHTPVPAIQDYLERHVCSNPRMTKPVWDVEEVMGPDGPEYSTTYRGHIARRPHRVWSDRPSADVDAGPRPEFIGLRPDTGLRCHERPRPFQPVIPAKGERPVVIPPRCESDSFWGRVPRRKPQVVRRERIGFGLELAHIA